jgi:hypothetical protein
MNVLGNQVDPYVEGLLRAAAADDNRIAMTVDKVLAKLSSAGLAYKMQIPCQLVGVHPSNRDGRVC